jgi:hypothetical protein
MNTSKRFFVLAVFAAAFALSACSKTQKTSSAGGGASSQSVLTFRGASR